MNANKQRKQSLPDPFDSDPFTLIIWYDITMGMSVASFFMYDDGYKIDIFYGGHSIFRLPVPFP